MKAWKTVLRRREIELSAAQLEQCAGITSDEFAERIECQWRYSLKPDRQQTVAEKQSVFAELARTDLELVPGVDDFLHDVARKYPLGLCTMATRDRTEDILDRFGWRTLFDAVVTRDQTPRPKPDPSIYLKVSSELHTPPQNILAFEDTPLGIAAAIAAGMQVVAVATTYDATSLRETKASRIIPHFVNFSLDA